MKEKGFGSQSGKSILELVAVLVVVAVIVTMAITNTEKAQSNLQRQNYAREFKINLERARFDSVKRRPRTTEQMARVVITSDTAYRVHTDLNQNGALNDTDVKNVTIPSQSRVKLLNTNTVYPLTIRFDWRGQMAVLDANDDDVTPTFVFCEGSCTIATADASNANIILISPTGTVSMLSGNQSQPTFTAPNVTAVNGNTNVNPWVTISQTVPATPTPTPNPDATPTPTPTPDTNSTPTPTPLVVYCASGQRPSQTGCVCRLPMTVRTNGKCM